MLGGCHVTVVHGQHSQIEEGSLILRVQSEKPLQPLGCLLPAPLDDGDVCSVAGVLAQVGLTFVASRHLLQDDGRVQQRGLMIRFQFQSPFQVGQCLTWFALFE